MTMQNILGAIDWEERGRKEKIESAEKYEVKSHERYVLRINSRTGATVS